MAEEFVNKGQTKARNSVGKAIKEHPAAAEQDTAMEASVPKGQGITSEVTFYYFDLMGRADPLQ